MKKTKYNSKIQKNNIQTFKREIKTEHKVKQKNRKWKSRNKKWNQEKTREFGSLKVWSRREFGSSKCKKLKRLYTSVARACEGVLKEFL